MYLPDAEMNELVARAKAGDRVAADGVVDQVIAFVMRAAKRRWRPGRVPLDDLVQAGLLAVTRSIHGFDASLGFKFLTYASRGIITEIIRESKQWRDYRQFDSEWDWLSEIPEKSEVPNMDVERKDRLMMALRRILRPRELSLLCRWFGLGCESENLTEIAESLGVSRQAVQQRIERSIQVVRYRLESGKVMV